MIQEVDWRRPLVRKKEILRIELKPLATIFSTACLSVVRFICNRRDFFTVYRWWDISLQLFPLPFNVLLVWWNIHVAFQIEMQKSKWWSFLFAVVVLLWLLHQKGLFDPLYDWWEDRFGAGTQKNSVNKEYGQPPISHHHEDDHHPYRSHHHNQEARHHRYDACNRQRSSRYRANHPELASDWHHHKHHHHHHHHRSHMDRHKHEHSDSPMDGKYESRMHRMERPAVKGLQKLNEENDDKHLKRKYSQKQEHLLSKMRTKNNRRE